LLAAFAAAVALVAFPGLAGADPTQTPDVVTEAPSAVTGTGATFNGTVNPYDSDAGAAYSFNWGTDTSYSNTPVTGTSPSGTTPQGVDAPMTGLSPGTTYHYELCATNSLSVTPTCGSDVEFTTPPTATTGAASSSKTSPSATLNGMVGASDDSASWVFAYGSSSESSCGAYSNTSPGGSVGSGTSSSPVSDKISGLSANTTYYFRLSVTNAYGTTCGAEGQFTTPDAPTVVAGSAIAGGASSETLNGKVNPNGATVTQTLFEYGTTGGYGDTTNASPSPGSGTSLAPVSASLTGLASGSVFHYTLCATNAYGTNCDPTDHTFTTDSLPTAVLTTTDTTSGPGPLTVTFDGSGSSDPNSGGGITSWKLTFGDGSPAVTNSTAGAELSAIPHTYAAAATAKSYTATLTVTDVELDTATATQVIHVSVNQPPVASLTASTNSGTVPLAITFDGSGSYDPDNIPLQSWSVDFGDGNSTGLKTGPVSDDIQHTYTTPGPYTATLTVTDSSGATDTATQSITVNPVPSISINDVTQLETTSGTSNFVFTLTLSATSTNDVKVNYATADGTATAGTDYNATSGTLKIPAGTSCPGDPSCQITVQVIGSTRYENAKAFTVNLSNPVGATIADGTGTGTILNNNQPPLLIIQSGASPEGNTGSLVSGAQSWGDNGNLQVADASGMPSTEGPHTFYTSTPHQPAISAPYTYQGVSGNTLTGVSPAGSVSAGQWAFQPRTITLTVLVCDPVLTIGTDPGDCVPTTSGSDTTVKYSTSDGNSADTHIPVVEGQDYVYSAGTLDIPAGAQSGQINVWDIPNTTPENLSNTTEDVTRFFFVNLSSPVGATIRWGLGSATIIEDDGFNAPIIKSTSPASGIGADHATICTVVNANGAATDVLVQYGPTDAYGKQTPVQSLPTGFTDQSLCFSPTGLSPGTMYHYQVVADHPYPPPLTGGVTTYGDQMDFATDKLPIAVLKADKTTGYEPFTATFNGSASSDPDGSISSWRLAFGDGSSTSGTGTPPSSIPHVYTKACACTASLTVTDNESAQSTPANVLVHVLDPGPAPMLFHRSAKAKGPHSANVKVSVDPKGAGAQVSVEYGTTSSYGKTTRAQTVRAGSIEPLTFKLKNLKAHTTYYYSVVAVHADTGHASPSDGKFATPKPKPKRVARKH
jgi:PKD repeat protein